jgi:uncharacterized radical SAM superfamily protein
VLVAFHQGVRDEKMLEKLATHDIQDVSALFSLADKCYISKVLHEAKTRYLEVHKLLYAVIIASRKLRHYF